jgi:glyoxylase-like metal-dependent hydrolase (beta-lactamase superfamily II)
VCRFRVALSHWHADHVAGNVVFTDCEIIARHLTLQLMETNRARLEDGTPPIRPLVMPNRIFEDSVRLQIGSIEVNLLSFDIHSRDATVAHLPEHGLLLVGDALEDPITYVAESERLRAHLVDLDRLSELECPRLLPAHGAQAVIEAGGYGPGLLAANRRYVEKLLRTPAEPDLREQSLATFAADDFAAGHIHYFAPYESVHRQNVMRVTGGITK